MDFWNLMSELEERSIKPLIVSLALLLLIAYVLKICRWWARSRFRHWILLILDAISDHMVTYSIGLMQHSTSPLISIWAVLLLILSDSNSNFDRSKVNRLQSELAYLMNYIFAAVLNLSIKYSIVTLVAWILWLLHLCKFVLLSWVFELGDASYRHGKNSRLIADYMRHEHELNQQQEWDPATMDGYKYLVHGEGKSKSKLEPKEPDYLVKLEVGNEEKLITLEKVWQCKGRLLNSDGDPDCKLKDLCLSFALYKLIRRRFDDLHPPPVADHRKAHELLHEGLLSPGQDYSRVFRVIEIELTFLNDYFNTLLPALLFTRCVVFYTLILVSFGMVSWLLVIVTGELWHYTIESFITIALVCMVILRGVFEVQNYVFSDWTKMLLLCKYVEDPSWHDNAQFEMLLRFFCGLKFVKHWHNKICQYHLLKSFCHDSILRSSRESTKKTFKTMVKKGTWVKVPEEAKAGIFESLSKQISSGRLSNGTVSLQRNELDEKLSWACKMKTNVHTILVWHVATCLCEINMSLRHCVARRSIRNCFRPASFMLDWRSLNGAKLQANYVVASSLSQYCAYLLAFSPKLLRYHELIINYILKKTAAEARDILKIGRARSIKDLYDRLWDAAPRADRGEEADNIMMMGARLARSLVEDIVDEERIWKVLADFWAEMVLYIAPCQNIYAHKENLDTGGEFLTHLWALLYHTGINKINDEAPVPGVAKEEQQHQPASPASSRSDMC